MEYIIVNFVMMFLLLLLWHDQIYNCSTGEWKKKLGSGIQEMFQWVLSGIALPIP